MITIKIFYHPVSTHQVSNRLWHITQSRPHAFLWLLISDKAWSSPIPTKMLIVKSFWSSLISFNIWQSYMVIYRPVTRWNKWSLKSVACIEFIFLFMRQYVWGAMPTSSPSGIEGGQSPYTYHDPYPSQPMAMAGRYLHQSPKCLHCAYLQVDCYQGVPTIHTRHILNVECLTHEILHLVLQINLILTYQTSYNFEP